MSFNYTITPKPAIHPGTELVAAATFEAGQFLVGWQWVWLPSDMSESFPIAGATGGTYIVGRDMVGKRINVELTYWDGSANATESLTENITAVVTD